MTQKLKFDIDVDDLIVFGSGGEPNKMYVFTFIAHDIPETVENVRFEWSPGIGAVFTHARVLPMERQVLALSFHTQSLVLSCLKSMYMMMKRTAF